MDTSKLYEIRRVVPKCESSAGYAVYDTMRSAEDAQRSLRQLQALGHWGWIVTPDGSDLTARPPQVREWMPRGESSSWPATWVASPAQDEPIV